MHIEPTAIDGVLLLRWDSAADERGSFARTFSRVELAEAGVEFEIVQASLSRNPVRHTLRGLHYQKAPHGEGKIVSCLAGRIWDVAVDLRRDSSTYLRWRAFELSAQTGCSLYLAPGIAHGFLTLEPGSDVQYLMDAPFVPEAFAGVRWDDPAIGIDWPAPPALISERDRTLASLAA